MLRENLFFRENLISSDFLKKTDFLVAYIKTKNTNVHIYFPESGSGKHFQASGICAIDFPHKIIPIWIIFRIFENKFSDRKNMKKLSKFRFFRYTLYSFYGIFYKYITQKSKPKDKELLISTYFVFVQK